MALDKEFLEKIYDKQEKMSDDISEIKVTLSAQHESLKLHMKRSDLLEQHLEVIRGDVKPIQTHVAMIQGAGKLLVILAGLIGFLTGVVKLIEFIKS